METSAPEKCRYEINVEGMTCVKCTTKVEQALKDLENPVENLKVDFITNRVIFTAANQASLEAATIKLQGCGFKVKDTKDVSYTVSNDRRKLFIKILKGDHGIIAKTLMDKEESLLIEPPQIIGDKCSLVYNPIFVRGNEVINKLNNTPEAKEGSFAFKIEDFFEDRSHNIKFSEFSLIQVILILIFNVLLVVASLIDSDENKMAPHSNGIYSYYFICVFVLTALTIATVGLKIYITCFRQLFSNLNVNMMTLVSVGSGLGLIFGIVYLVWGTVQMITGMLDDPMYFIMNGTDMFFTAATILTAVVVGKYIEGRIKKRVSDRIEDLKKQLKVNVENVTRILPRNKRFDILSSENLPPVLVEKDDYILIKEPCMIPFDGFIEKGTLKIVENFQYGWEKVETKTKGHPIMSGSQVVQVQEPTIIRVTEPIEKTVAGRLFYEIKEAASGSSSDQSRTADVLSKVTKYFIGIVIIIAICTLISWGVAYLTDSIEKDVTFFYPFEKAIAVLVASCPCALGIAIPMVYAIALRKGFRSGVMIKDTSSLDILHSVDTVIFDKTGTITGTYNIKAAQNITNKYDDASLWEVVSILERDHLQHPIGLALYQEALQRISNLEKPKYAISKNDQDKSLHEYHASEGIIDKGIKFNAENKTVSLGNKKLLKRMGIEAVLSKNDLTIIELGAEKPKSNDQNTDLEAKQHNEVTLNLCVDNELQFVITLSLEETLKNNVVKLISGLKRMKKDILILSGDTKPNAEMIGLQLGIPLQNVHAELAPEDKEQRIRDLINIHKKKVMMVGDGINDIKAFKAASVSCSINFKSSQNLTFSDFIIIDNDVENILGLFILAKALTKFKIIILVISFLYNIPTITAASGAYMTVAGIDLPAFMAAWAMVLFSVILTGVANLMEFVKVKSKHNEKAKKSAKIVPKSTTESINSLKELVSTNNNAGRQDNSQIESIAIIN